MSRRVKTRLGQFCGILVGGTMDLSHFIATKLVENTLEQHKA